MENSCSIFALLLLKLLITITQTLSSPTTTQDQNALLAFKNTIIASNPNYNNNLLSKNWSTNSTSDSVCHWIGVSCGSKHRRVTALDISDFALVGPLPQDLGNLTFLMYLDISSNNFTGPLPHELSSLPRLREINASFNSFSGKIPSSLFDFGSCKLRMIDLGNNQLEGRIPPSIRKCRELEVLSLSHNNFSEEIPSEIGGLSKLKEIYLGYNDFKGGIPSELGNLSLLEVLRIKSGSLTGSIPTGIGNCTSLQKLDLRDNHLTGPIPDEIWNRTSLRGLYLANNYLTGSLPSNLSVFNLEILFLDGNRLTGKIPSSIVVASNLSVFQLSNNSFSGSIPNLSGLKNLICFHVAGNKVSGVEFLSSLTESRFLERLDVSSNPLNGILPDSLGNLSKNLRFFSAFDCNLSGSIPSTVGNLSGLQRLILERNRLSGFIPSSIGDLNQLQGLHLGNNRLTGYMPRELCRLNSTIFFHLSMHDNFLRGPIPECLGKVVSLGELFLDSNELSSTIPSDFWNLTGLVFLNLSSNHFTGQLSSRLASLKAINTLDFSHNQFSGSIPSLIDSCQSLVFLSLSNNELEGEIPSSFGNMRGLITLDLSSNNLSGSIPRTLERLDSLQTFNVSNNKLKGQIPEGGRFLSFPDDSFSNNSGLCRDNRTSRLKKAERLLKYVIPPFVSVILISLGAVIVILTRRKKRKLRAQDDVITPGKTWRRFSYIELERGTNSFSTETNLLGRGSFGSVFKATLPDKLVVAVKVFNLRSERAVRSFDTECEILGTVRHRNLVRVIGCCSNTEFKALILEHMANGSLEKWLHSDKCCLNLRRRLQIAIDVGLALEYLHHRHTFQIVHCDVKPSNVLLDGDMVARLADFGISKLFEDGEIMVHTQTLATIGYASPEYGGEGKVSTNGDVYSYGILLLEMFTKKKPTDEMFSAETSLKEWVYRALQENRVTEVVAPDFLARDDAHKLHATEEECVSSIFNLAMKCLAFSPDERINMTEAVSAVQSIKAKVDISAEK